MKKILFKASVLLIVSLLLPGFADASPIEECLYIEEIVNVSTAINPDCFLINAENGSRIVLQNFELCFALAPELISSVKVSQSDYGSMPFDVNSHTSPFNLLIDGENYEYDHIALTSTRYFGGGIDSLFEYSNTQFHGNLISKNLSGKTIFTGEFDVVLAETATPGGSRPGYVCTEGAIIEEYNTELEEHETRISALEAAINAIKQWLYFGIYESLCEAVSNNCQSGPSDCVLIGVSWNASATGAVEGEPVQLIVTGDNCDGETVSFEIFEYDGSLNPDDNIVRNPSGAQFVEGTATGTWEAEYQDDTDGGQENPPEYYFKVSVQSTGETMDNKAGNLLAVEEGCTDTCDSSGYNCGYHVICGVNTLCGNCSVGYACNSTGQCVTSCTPNCAGKQCGSNGCGGICGTCTAGYTCTSGNCVSSTPSWQTGMVSRWKLDGNTKDSAGNHDGTVIGATLSSDCKSGQCYDFDGSNDYISIPNSPQLTFGGNNFTISAWVNHSPVFNSTHRGIYSKGSTGTSSGEFAFYISYANHLRFIMQGSATENGKAFVGDNTWHHVVAVREGNSLKMYSDGVLDASNNVFFSGVNLNDAENPRIGWRDSNRYFDGKMDEVMVWNRSLSESEIVKVYNYFNASSSFECGDGICNGIENCGTCQTDCACSAGKGCISEECVECETQNETCYGRCGIRTSNCGQDFNCVVCGEETAIIINHVHTNLSEIPDYWIERAKKLTVHYAHTSHGSQIISGLSYLEDYVDSKYSVSVRESSSEGLHLQENPPALRIYDGNPPETYIEPNDYWDGQSAMNRTRAVANTGNYNYSMWSWCGQQSSNTEERVNNYLSAMSNFEDEYPSMRFILMTGHTENTSSVTTSRNNNLVRAYAMENNMVLFDFADLEEYDPDGNYYENADDSCVWCESWCQAHPVDCQNLPSCAHSHGLLCVEKAKAIWWMMARLAGWSGASS